MTRFSSKSHKDSKPEAPAFSVSQSALPTPPAITYFPATARYSLTDVVEKLRGLWIQSGQYRMDLAGSFVVGEEELAVAGSKGLAQYQPFSIAGLRLVATQGKSSGFASQVVRDLTDLNYLAIAQRAWKFCRMNRNPRNLPVGRYNVLLEPEAVAELLEWLNYIGFGAKQVIERTSFMAGRIGERLMSHQLSIIDDGSDPEGLAVPFDYEGVPKRRVSLIEQGVASGIAYDSHYAKLHQTASTGHAGPYDQFEGPIPAHIFLLPGQTAHDELLKRMDRGLWICRFHYVNGLLKPLEALMTGLTRDGTFLVHNGKVAGAVKNLRFTQSILEAFSKVLGVSQERRLVADPGHGLSATVTPALLIRDFTFTGQTQ